MKARHEMTITQWAPKLRCWLALACGLATLLAACAPDLRGRRTLVVASADTPEQLLIGQVTILALQAEGYRVVDKTGLGSPEAVRTALERGRADICWEYTDQVWCNYLQHDEPIADPVALHARVRAEDALNQITWLPMTSLSRTQGLVMRRSLAEAWQVRTLSDLSYYMGNRNPQVRLCAPQPQCDATSGIRGLERVYRMDFNDKLIRFGSIQEGYASLAKGECDCALGVSNDAEPVQQGFVFLQDDKGFFHASNLAPAVRTPLLGELPTLEASLLQIGQLFDAATLAALQRRMNEEDLKPSTVAREFLTERGLIGRKRPTPTLTLAPTVTPPPTLVSESTIEITPTPITTAQP